METFPVSPLSPQQALVPPPGKAPWKSKTLWANLLMALLSMNPKTGALVAQYPTAGILIVAAVNFILRLVTHGRIAMDN